MNLVDVVQELSFARDLLAVQEIVRRAARSLTGADGATFVLRDKEECYYADEDAIAPLWKGMRFPMQACISGWSMLHRHAAVIPDIYADARIPSEAYRPTFVKSLVMVPIRSRDPIGAIGNYWATYHEATAGEVQVLQALADATAVAMENVCVYNELEQRVRERTKELEAARQAAQEALQNADQAHRARSRFLATASHDLRQPLQSLALLNGSLHRIVTDSTASEALAQQDLAISAASRLVNALLDISKLESGAVKPEITDVAIADLFEELRQEFTNLAVDKGLTLRVDTCTECVRSDRSLLGQILRNLISNAIKYTRDGTVRLRCLRDSAIAHVQVLDTGVGIPPDLLPHIFDEFYQVGVASNKSRDGYGLGLSIVNRLVKLLGLKLDVKSEPGRGSVFSLELPVSVAALADRRPPEATRVVARDRTPALRRRVLLVEDDNGVRHATRLLLKAAGYEVIAAASPAEAFSKASQYGSIDLLITDYHLGCAETGLDVIAALRREMGEQLKVILVSGDTSPVIKDLVLDENIRLASKPVPAEQLLQLMSDLAGEAEAVSAPVPGAHRLMVRVSDRGPH